MSFLIFFGFIGGFVAFISWVWFCFVLMEETHPLIGLTILVSPIALIFSFVS